MDSKPRVFDRVGSFQRGTYIWSENPLEELWSHVARHGSPEWLLHGLTSSNPDLSVKDMSEYAAVRFRQAVEFREAAATGTLLTSPLPLYYSFLNLMRAATAVHTSKIPAKAHGLRFQEQPTIMQCRAQVGNGTFADFLTGTGSVFSNGDTFSLEDCLALIPELEDVYESSPWNTFVVPLKAVVRGSGDVLLQFHYDKEEEFVKNWETWFPALTDTCTLEESGTLLRVNSTLTLEEATQFFADHLLVHLTRLEYAKWYSVKHVTPAADLPRAAVYFVALFILGSVVRYQPEVMLEVAKPGSEQGWYLGRFLRVAERFYPNLLINWMNDQNVFF